MLRTTKGSSNGNKSDKSEQNTKTRRTRSQGAMSPGKQLLSNFEKVNKAGKNKKEVAKIKGGVRGNKAVKKMHLNNSAQIISKTKANGAHRSSSNVNKKTRSVRKVQKPLRFRESDNFSESEDEFSKFDQVFNASSVEDDVLLDVSASEDNFHDDEDMEMEPTLTQEFAGQSSPAISSTQRIMDMRNDPVFKEMLNQAVAEQMKLVRQKEGSEQKPKTSNVSNAETNMNLHDKDKHDKGVSNRQNVKSPSDMTIYAPGLHLANKMSKNSPHKSVNEMTINQISDFVERIRIDTQHNDSLNDRLDDEPGSSKGGRDIQRTNVMSSQDQVQAIADKMIIDAEQYRASIDKPAGRSNCEIDKFAEGDNQFFHITCHVDSVLKCKIEHGNFVELEKLLPKDRTKKIVDDHCMELVNRDGATFFIPASDKDNKITNVRKWEQAFRVYAAIYSRANPHRSAEIWQYVYTINLAATSFIWDNVPAYDYTFRQLMAKYPSRS